MSSNNKNVNNIIHYLGTMMGIARKENRQTSTAAAAAAACRWRSDRTHCRRLAPRRKTLASIVVGILLIEGVFLLDSVAAFAAAVTRGGGGRASSTPDAIVTTTTTTPSDDEDTAVAAVWKARASEPQEARLIVLHITDVYTLEHLASFKTLLEETRANARGAKTICVLTGDFLSPYVCCSTKQCDSLCFLALG